MLGAWVLEVHGKGQAQRLGAGLVRVLLAAIRTTLLEPWRPLAATGPAAVSPPSAVAIARPAATTAPTTATAAVAAAL